MNWDIPGRDKLTMIVSKEAFRNWYEDRMRSRKLFPKVKDGQFRVILHVGIFKITQLLFMKFI